MALTLVSAACGQTPPVNQLLVQGSTRLESLSSFRPIIERIMPAVVNISVTERIDAVQRDGTPFGLPGPGFPEGLPLDELLQVDVSINCGNSGGPTFNTSGEVIGINTAIFSPTGGSVGIGFAIPSNLAQTVIAQLRDHGQVVRGWLGVQIQEVTPEIAQGLGWRAACWSPT
jgi:S1-C subfamily serine protease